MPPKFSLRERVAFCHSGRVGRIVSRTLALPPYRYGVEFEDGTAYHDIREHDLARMTLAGDGTSFDARSKATS